MLHAQQCMVLLPHQRVQRTVFKRGQPGLACAADKRRQEPMPRCGSLMEQGARKNRTENLPMLALRHQHAKPIQRMSLGRAFITGMHHAHRRIRNIFEGRRRRRRQQPHQRGGCIGGHCEDDRRRTECADRAPGTGCHRKSRRPGLHHAGGRVQYDAFEPLRQRYRQRFHAPAERKHRRRVLGSSSLGGPRAPPHPLPADQTAVSLFKCV